MNYYSTIKSLSKAFNEYFPIDNMGFKRSIARKHLEEFLNVNIGKSTFDEYTKHCNLKVDDFKIAPYSRGFYKEHLLIIALYKYLIFNLGMEEALNIINDKSKEALKWLVQE